MPVKTLHNRYLFIKLYTEEDVRRVVDRIKEAFILLHGYILFGHARIKKVEYNYEKRILVIRVDSKFINHLVIALKHVSIKTGADIEYIGVSSTLKRGRKKFIRDDK